MPVRNPAPTGPGTAALIEDFREAFVHMEALVLEVVPSNRERALALTNLEQAAMWATKAILEGTATPEALAKGREWERTMQRHNALVGLIVLDGMGKCSACGAHFTRAGGIHGDDCELRGFNPRVRS